MSILWVMLVGLVVGALAKLVMPGRDPGGILLTMLLGMAGSLIAFLIGESFGWYRGAGEGPGIFASVLGSILVLFVYRMSRRRTV